MDALDSVTSDHATDRWGNEQADQHAQHDEHHHQFDDRHASGVRAVDARTGMRAMMSAVDRLHRGQHRLAFVVSRSPTAFNELVVIEPRSMVTCRARHLVSANCGELALAVALME